jgi:hypothetical protein
MMEEHGGRNRSLYGGLETERERERVREPEKERAQRVPISPARAHP